MRFNDLKRWLILGLSCSLVISVKYAFANEGSSFSSITVSNGQKDSSEIVQDSVLQAPSLKLLASANESQSDQELVGAEIRDLNKKNLSSDGKIVTERIPNKDVLDGHEKLLKDIHILMGLGVNQSFYSNDSQESVTELGPSLKADVVYLINQDWAVEWSGIAAFKEFSEILVWDTLLTLGVRKVMGSSYLFNGTWFTRYYLGYGHSVAYVDRAALTELGYSGDINRIHFGGEVLGLGAGMVWETESKKLHFFELNMGVHYLKNREAVNIQNDVPVVVANDVVTDNSRAYHVHLTYGVLLF